MLIYYFSYCQGDVGQETSSKLEVTGTEVIVTPIINKRESKPSVQLMSLFLNTFGSSSENAYKPQRNTMKIIIFELKAYLFRIDLNAGPTNEAQKMFYGFLFYGLKHRNK